MLEDEDDYVRETVVLALGAIRDPGAVEALMEVLKDVDVEVRRSAALVLGAIGDARAVEALEEALKDLDEIVRETAAQALEKIEAKQKSTNTEAEDNSSDR